MGKVLEKKNIENSEFQHTFEVIEPFKGVKTEKQIQITANENEGICGYIFNLGETYIVFARNIKSSTGINSLRTGSCSGNKIFEFAESSLTYLRNNDDSSKIAGSVRQTSDFTLYKLNEVKITAQEINNRKKTFYGTTDKKGYFEIKVPAGKYTVTPNLPKGYLFETRRYNEGNDVEIVNQKCAEKYFYVGNDSEISGALLNNKGKTLSNIYVELIPLYFELYKNSNRELSKTDKNGVFRFKYVPVGKYLVSINYTSQFSENKILPTYFYPQAMTREQAQIIEINYATKINNLIFKVPSKINN